MVNMVNFFARSAGIELENCEGPGKFSEVLREVVREPQMVYNRETLVAVVIDPVTYQEWAEWKERQTSRTLDDFFGELRRIEEEEDYALLLPERSDRANAFVEHLS